MSDRNDPNRYSPGQQGTRILVNQSDLNQIDVPFDIGQINEVEGLLKDVRGLLTGITEGSINVNQFDLNAATDSVTALPLKASTISNSTPASTHGTALAANANRKELYVQNLGTAGVLIKLGDSPTTSSYNVHLTGSYNVYRDESYTGIVTTTGFSNNPSFIAWEKV